MIRILQDWNEIGAATKALAQRSLPPHGTVQKNWDLAGMVRVVDPLNRECSIIDLGFGKGEALKVLAALGFRNAVGVDFDVPLRARLSQLRGMARRRQLRPPYRLLRGNITHVALPDRAFDVALCISTIEHGVSLQDFFMETARLTKSGGQLFVTTDFWCEPLALDPSTRPFGMSWRIFDPAGIRQLVGIAAGEGFRLVSENDSFECGDPCVCWLGHEYTFMSLLFERKGL